MVRECLSVCPLSPPNLHTESYVTGFQRAFDRNRVCGVGSESLNVMQALLPSRKGLG